MQAESEDAGDVFNFLSRKSRKKTPEGRTVRAILSNETDIYGAIIAATDANLTDSVSLVAFEEFKTDSIYSLTFVNVTIVTDINQLSINPVHPSDILFSPKSVTTASLRERFEPEKDYFTRHEDGCVRDNYLQQFIIVKDRDGTPYYMTLTQDRIVDSDGRTLYEPTPDGTAIGTAKVNSQALQELLKSQQQR